MIILVGNVRTLDPEFYPLSRFRLVLRIIFNTIVDLIRKIFNNYKQHEVSFWCSTPLRRDLLLKTEHNDRYFHHKLDRNYPIAFIIHGWTDFAHMEWVQRMARGNSQYL